jgi:hypothetical protein
MAHIRHTSEEGYPMVTLTALLCICRGARAFFMPGLRHAVLAVLLALGTAGVPAETMPVPLSKARQAQLEAMLTGEIQRVVNAQKRIEGQGRDVAVSVRFDASAELFVIDLSETYVPRVYGAEMEDLQHELSTVVYQSLRDTVRFNGVEFRFGGKDIYHYFPEEWRPTTPARDRGALPTASATVVVAAGHGIYYHHGFKDWRDQRDPSNTITEDFITPGYATELSTWLSARSGITPRFPRSTAMTTHMPSGQPWGNIGARYHLQAIYPDNPEIWHSLPNATGNLRERNEDIRSRPLYANHIGASTVLHLHTNAANDASATGALAFYQNGRAEDKRLADSILCYMKELIQAREVYKNYMVSSQSRSEDFGENRLATMPSVIVEAGFHTNPSDATALKDPVFRRAAMKGVEKGYRLNAEGKACEPFKIGSIPDATGLQGVPIPVEVHYKGYPQFAVKAKVISCPSGWSCSGGELAYADKLPSPLKYFFTCNATSRPPANFRIRTRLSDTDEVSPEPVEHNLTCTPAAQGTPGVAPVGRPSMSIGLS